MSEKLDTAKNKDIIFLNFSCLKHLFSWQLLSDKNELFIESLFNKDHSLKISLLTLFARKESL